MNNRTSGSCLCGAIRFEADLPAEWFHYCHCAWCRKATASAHTSHLFFRPERFRWLAGAELVVKFVDETTNPGYKREFCRVCGAAVPRLNRTRAYVVVPGGLLDDDPEAKPERSIYWAERAPWYVATGDLPKFTEGKDSCLMAE